MSAQLTHETAPATTTTTTPATATATATATNPGPLATLWHRIIMAIREMNYASQRIVEVQAPWTTDGGRR
jgi:hypothetical protein